jgi:hypothetical protein
MRRGLLAFVLVAFGAWFVWKALPFLDAQRAAISSTPTTRPTDPTNLIPIMVRRGQRLCLDQVDFGPDARFAQVTVQGKHPSPPIRVEAAAPGYRASATIAPGVATDNDATAQLTPAARETTGTLCFINEGRYAVSFYGISPGKGLSPSNTTLDGTKAPSQLSVTLLTRPSQSIGARLSSIASHIAAFRPLTGWEVWLIGLLAVLGVPVLVGLALARSAAADDALEAAAVPAGAPPDPADELQASARR